MSVDRRSMLERVRLPVGSELHLDGAFRSDGYVYPSFGRCVDLQAVQSIEDSGVEIYLSAHNIPNPGLNYIVGQRSSRSVVTFRFHDISYRSIVTELALQPIDLAVNVSQNCLLSCSEVTVVDNPK